MLRHDACHKLAADPVRAGAAPDIGLHHERRRQIAQAVVARGAATMGPAGIQHRGDPRRHAHHKGIHRREESAHPIPQRKPDLLPPKQPHRAPPVAGPPHERAARNHHDSHRTVVRRHPDPRRQFVDQRGIVHILSGGVLQHHQPRQGDLQGAVCRSVGPGLDGARRHDPQRQEPDPGSGRTEGDRAIPRRDQLQQRVIQLCRQQRTRHQERVAPYPRRSDSGLSRTKRLRQNDISRSAPAVLRCGLRFDNSRRASTSATCASNRCEASWAT